MIKIPIDEIDFDEDLSTNRNARLVMDRLKSMFHTVDDEPTDFKVIIKNIGIFYDKGDEDSLQKIVNYLSDVYNISDLLVNHNVDEKFLVKLWTKTLKKAKSNKIKLYIPENMNEFLKQNNLLEINK